MIKRALFFILLGVPAYKAFAQSEYWCNEFYVPQEESVCLPEDSMGLELSSAVSLYQTFKTRNRLDWERYFSWGFVEQTAEYQFQQFNPQSRIQSVNLSGNIIRKNLLIEGLDAGFDWAPVFSFSKRQTGTMQSSIDIGPAISHSFLSIPYSLRGGLYGYAWNNTAGTLWEGGYQADPGLYINGRIGDPQKRVDPLPLYLYVDATGRSIRRNNIGLLSASALYADELMLFGGGDSIFVHAGDSITNGKEIYLGDSTGISLLSNTSWRINHSFSASAGIKTIERLGTRSRLYYRYYLNSVSYPSESRTLNDIRTTFHALGVGINTKEDFNLIYSGGIEFVWKFEDWLYRRHFSKEEVATDINRDSLIVNLSDLFSDIARTDHTITVRLPPALTLKYSLYAFKDSKKYPFSYIDPASFDKIRKNQNENDRVRINHKAAARFGRDSLKFTELYGSYGILYHYYFRTQRQAESRQTKEYRIGLDAGISMEKFEVREHIYGDAEVSDYYFKKIGDARVKPPPYSRDITSTLSCKLKLVKDRFNVLGRWIEMYHDEGLWYGTEYMPDSIGLSMQYYAVERKLTQYWLDFAAEYMNRTIKITAGSMFRDVFQRRFDRECSCYKGSETDFGYGIEPYLMSEWMTDAVLIKVKLKRIINTADKQKWNLESNWDISLSLQIVF